MQKIIILIFCVVLQPFVQAQNKPIAPIFLHGDGVDFGLHPPRARAAAMKIITTELGLSRLSPQFGPLLLDGFTTEEISLNLEPSFDVQLVRIAHPFFFDLFIPELGIAVKYIEADDCRNLGYGEYVGIDAYKADLLGAIQFMREKLGEKSPVPFVFFYDPIPQGEGNHDQEVKALLRAQVADFLKWANNEWVAGRLPFKTAKPLFGIPENRREEMRALANDKTQKTGIRLAAIEWLGAARDIKSISIFKDVLEDADSQLYDSAIRSLGQVGGKEAESILISWITSDAAEEHISDVLQTLNAMDQLWHKSKEAKDMLLKWDFENRSLFVDEMKAALAIDSAWAIKKSIDALQAGDYIDADAYNELLRHCTKKELPMVLDSLPDARSFSKESDALLARLDPDWRNNPRTRNAIKKLVQNLIFLLNEDYLEAENETKMVHDILLLDHLDPKWRDCPEVRKQIRLIADKSKKEADLHFITSLFFISGPLQNREADQRVELWWQQLGNDDYSRREFVGYIADFKPRKFIPLLKQSLKWDSEENEELRAIILSTFGEYGGHETHASILRGLRDASPRIRRSATWAAAKQKIAKARTVIEKMLETETEKDGVMSSARALSQMGKPQSIRPLIRALKKLLNDPGVACQIIKTLSVWNTPEVETAMNQFLKSAALWAQKSQDGDGDEFYLNDARPDAGVEGAIRWAIRNNRKSMWKYIAPFKTCSSPRHRAIAQAAEYYLQNQ
jgi:HEAT repeat protein